MSSKKTVNFQGLNLPFEFKETCDYLNNLSAEEAESCDKEIWANIISNNPTGIGGYIAFNEAVINVSARNFIAKYYSNEYKPDLTQLRHIIENNHEPTTPEILEKDFKDISQITISDEYKFAKEKFKELMRLKEVKEIYSAFECVNANIPHAAIVNIEAFYRGVYLSEQTMMIILRASEIAANRSNAKKAGKKGATKRWEPKEKAKQYAIELYQKGTFKNPSQAAEKLTPQIFEYSKSIGFHFSGIFQANKTIYKWLLDTK